MISASPRTAATAVFFFFTAVPLLPQTVRGPFSKPASNPLWRDIPEQAIAARLTSPGTIQRRDIDPLKYRTVQLNKSALTTALGSVVAESGGSLERTGLEIQMPHPSGGFRRFLIHESPIMEPDLARKFPEIKTYVGRSLD